MERDPSTGLLSYKLIQEYISTHSECSVILMDIDKLHVFNACYGPHEGDQAIITVANVIRQVVPAQYPVFRSGGDEFTVVMERLPEAQIIQFARQVREAVEAQFSHLPVGQWFNVLRDNPKAQMQLIPFTLSCGIAFYPEHGQTFQDLCKVLYDSVFSQQEDHALAVAHL